MAKIFLDANILIDIVEERQDIDLDAFKGCELLISPLSIHLLTYLYKYKTPDKKLLASLQKFILVPFDDTVVENSLLGPTADFEDNVQLHSSAQAECDFFMTSDKELLTMKFFGKTRITQNISEQ